jgi:uncharacterized protein YqcC (DUF446 family)
MKTDQTAIYQKAELLINQIEQELKNIGEWQEKQPDPKLFENMGAFGSHTMPFTTWLQFVLISNVRKIVLDRGTFPTSSAVATYAYRNFEDRKYEELNALLSKFDELFN